MDWQRPSAGLTSYLDNAMDAFNCQKTRMFGCPAYFANGNLFAGVQADNLFVRLSEEDRRRALATSDEVTIFEPVAGRQMKEYLVLPESMCQNEEQLTTWLRRAYQYACSLPPKKDKRKTRDF
jgi:TfoX/Sxy family transcriptional regulator of competence genes